MPIRLLSGLLIIFLITACKTEKIESGDPATAASPRKSADAVEQSNRETDVRKTASVPVNLTLPDGWRFPLESDCPEGDWELSRKEGTNPAHASADFNGDGILDNAWMLIQKDGKAWGLYVFLGREKDQPEMIVLAKYRDTDKRYRSDEYCMMGISVMQPGKYRTACAKGYGDPCGPDDLEEVTLFNPAVDFYVFESANSIFYWDGNIKNFKREWISD